MEPTPAVQNSSGFPAVTDKDHTQGTPNAVVTVIAYCDFQTPACNDLAVSMKKVMEQHQTDVHFVFRPLALVGSAQFTSSQLAAQAAYAADQQGKFWEMYTLLNDKYSQWAGLPPAAFEAWLIKEVTAAGFDMESFRSELKSPEAEADVRSSFDAAQKVGVTSLPLLLLNGIPQKAFVSDFTALNRAISVIAMGPKQFQSCPPFSISPNRTYIATLKTAKGDVVIQLFPEKAPLAVNSFVFLARNGWYDNTTFHRVLPGFVAQTGDPSGTGVGTPGYFFKNETDNGLHFDRPGMVGMANSGPDTNGSQFFITYTAQPSLDGNYTIFGQVIKGMDVLEQLTPRDPQNTDDLPVGDALISVTIDEK
jgi:cyclophilin family peptidyl-prolyl cis-trans isomerase/protein-disulfide isomerase